MQIDSMRLLQVHSQHLDWHSQKPMKDVAEKSSRIVPSLPHADYVFCKQALKAMAQPGEPSNTLAELVFHCFTYVVMP